MGTRSSGGSWAHSKRPTEPFLAGMVACIPEPLPVALGEEPCLDSDRRPPPGVVPPGAYSDVPVPARSEEAASKAESWQPRPSRLQQETARPSPRDSNTDASKPKSQRARQLNQLNLHVH